MADTAFAPAPPTGTGQTADEAEARRRRVLLVLGVAAVVVVAAYLVVGVQGSWAFALELRAKKVAAMTLVAVAIAVSTVLFQTVTTNRILTPGIMGFDDLYELIQTLAVFLLGALAFVTLPRAVRFAAEVGIMIGFAGVLYRALFGRAGRSIAVLVLAGIVVGTLFRSLASLLNRLIDPNEFQTLQDLLFASFGDVDEQLLAVSAVVVAVTCAIGWRARRELDVVALGRETALNLGVAHHRVVRRSLVVVAVLVSVATALVGPLTFFGLLVANLARQMLGTFVHRWLLPASALLGVVALVGGQLVLEHGLGYDTALTVIVNFVGGIYFIGLLLKEART